MISVRRTKDLPTASFRFHLTVDTLAVQLYTSSLPRRVRDFHPLERAHGAQTKKNGATKSYSANLNRINLILNYSSVRNRSTRFSLEICPNILRGIIKQITTTTTAIQIISTIGGLKVIKYNSSCSKQVIP